MREGGRTISSCMKCGRDGLGAKPFICGECMDEIFSEGRRAAFFCCQCRRSEDLSPEKLEEFKRAAGLEDMQTDKLVLIVSDSCPECFQAGDSTQCRLALLTPTPEA